MSRSTAGCLDEGTECCDAYENSWLIAVIFPSKSRNRDLGAFTKQFPQAAPATNHNAAAHNGRHAGAALGAFQSSLIIIIKSNLSFAGGHGSCIVYPVRDVTIAQSVVSFIIDCVLGLVPIVMFWNLQMGRRTKVSLAALLALGLLAGVATLLRIPYLVLLQEDAMYEAVDIHIWSTVETGLGIFAASASMLRPLYRSIVSNSPAWTASYPLSRSGRSRATYVQNNANSQDVSSEASGLAFVSRSHLNRTDSSSNNASSMQNSNTDEIHSNIRGSQESQVLEIIRMHNYGTSDNSLCMDDRRWENA
ncbi:hypothetical protein OIDMADRAFT_184569 [Oidiodendron maius Zn]|uniref:Rhodopsin domain-containing protein n=1 Tax=Oidiodendron maius (strain Zn) TaxID=913774 RepID=A0A0C3C5R3_OIDMZ|nr:hypothetical protein OIDMADRAFT_184569 [Oidiodendron maius Zn]